MIPSDFSAWSCARSRGCRAPGDGRERRPCRNAPGWDSESGSDFTPRAWQYVPVDRAHNLDIVINSEVDRVDWNQAKADLSKDDFDNGRSAHALRLSFLQSQHVALAWSNQHLVGMARMLSDGVCNSYLLDVWTASAFRRQGVGGRIVKYLLDQVPGQHVGLQTGDAGAFYRSLGFSAQPEFMSVVVGTWLGNAANRSAPDP